MNKKILILGAALGILAIVLGAFGAHGLEKLIDLEAQQTFETGVRYQMYHALFLLLIGSISIVTPKAKKAIFYLVFLGVVFFSGSIYGLATNSLTAFDFKQIAMITPIGGLFLILAWIVLIVNIVKTKID